VRHYKNLGYRTVAIHPYSKQFYRRDRVFPILGFDEFLDIQHFDSAERAGPFVSDAAVSALIERILQDNQKSGGPPLFIFVITMENHGPLHLEARDLRDADEDFQQALPAGCEDIGTYLKHLRHADAMIGRLTQALSRSTQRAGVLAWYGDHVPIMDQAYQVLGVPSRCTDYFVWSSAYQRTSAVQAIPVHTLGRAILDVSNQTS
jgi:phosphoglycerol transferase MdoB-like AlkP superfamily enzyme